VDFDEVFASVVKKQSLRILIALAAILGLEITHADCITAYLNSLIDKELYVRLPNGRVVRLKKALYGMKQSARCWQEHLLAIMQELGYLRLSSDQCIYINSQGEEIIIVAIYVDDLFVFSESPASADKFCDSLGEQVKLRKLGRPNKIIGMQIDYEESFIKIHQADYVDEILTRFGMTDAKPCKTPIVDMSEKEIMESPPLPSNKEYMEAVGCLLNLSNNTRLDIVYAISILSEKMQNPTELDWKRVKRVFRYLRGTRDFGLRYEKDIELSIQVYSDADFAGCETTRKSRTGILALLGNAPVIWMSKKQPLVTLSTVESEYVAASAAAQEMIWMVNILKEIGFNDLDATLLMDNQGAIAIANDPVHHGRTKHIDVRFHYIRDLVKEKIVKLEYCPTEAQLADIFTKGLNAVTFNRLLDTITRESLIEVKEANLVVQSTVIDLGGSVEGAPMHAMDVHAEYDSISDINAGSTLDRGLKG
jgi:hypothetical protein